jgi:hypothetical protein
MTTQPPGPGQWYRVVDASNQGWHPVGTGNGTALMADYAHDRGLHDYPDYEALAAARGPLRPVLPITSDDTAELRRLLGQAGRQAITTLAAAAEQVLSELRDQAEAAGPTRAGSYQDARTWLLAGREGSWESEALIEVALFGNGLNRAPSAGTVAGRRHAGPSKRVHARVRDGMAAVILRWVTDPARFTEVAETLAAVVSSYADDTHGAAGWAKVADQWLQPGSLARDDFRTCYSLFYSLSAHFDTSLL